MSLAKQFYKFQFSAYVRRKMYQAFVDYLQQGIPVHDIVKMLAASIIKANAKSQMFQVKILKNIEYRMSTGVDFSDALAYWVPISEVMSIRAGMRSGDPVSGMKNTIDSLDASSSMAGTIFSKLSYPAILIAALFGLIFFFSVAIIPRIADVMDPSLWPPAAKTLYNMANFVRDDWYIVVILMVVLGIVVNWSLPRITGQTRKYLDILPPYSFYKAFHGANMLISLASLMRSGIPFVEALKDMRGLSSDYLGEHLDKMVDNMAEGKDLGSSLDTGLLSSDMMVSVYMMSGNSNFQAAILEIGRQAVARSIEKIASIAGMLNGLALLGVTGYVGWVYYAFYTVSDAMAATVQ
jgi:type II secretory pathway component PulF